MYHWFSGIDVLLRPSQVEKSFFFVHPQKILNDSTMEGKFSNFPVNTYKFGTLQIP